MNDKDNVDGGELVVKENMEINPVALLKTAMDKGMDISVIKELMAMRDKIIKEQAESDYRQAMADFQGDCPVIEKKTAVKDKNGKTRFYYAKLDSIVEQVQPFLKKNGLSYHIETKNADSSVTTSVRVYHLGGHSEVSTFSAPIDKDAYMNDPQKYASASTFTKRYSFQNAFGILTGDGDDNGAGAGENKKEDKQKLIDEALVRIKPLSDKTKEGLRIAGYNALVADTFCKKFNYDDKKIMAEINKIIDSKSVKK